MNQKIVFTKSKKLFPIFSWIVRLWTWKSYSHVAIHKKILGENMFYQSNDSKVNYEHATTFNKKHEIVKVYCILIPHNLQQDIAIACLRESGKPYAALQNMGIAILDILNLLNIKIKNPWKKGKNCSEIIYETILKRLHPDLDYNPDTIKPHHIEQILIDKGYKPC